MNEVGDTVDRMAEEVTATANAAAEKTENVVEDVQAGVQDAAQGVADAVTEGAAPPKADRQPSLVDQVAGAVKGVAAGMEKSSGQVLDKAKGLMGDVEQNQIVRLLHKALLAGVGAVALAQDEMEDLVNRLVERGEIAESDGKRVLKDVVEQRRKTVEQVQKTAGEYLDHPSRAIDDAERRIEKVMARMNIPTKDEIEALSAKITALTRKVDELKKHPDDKA